MDASPVKDNEPKYIIMKDISGRGFFFYDTEREFELSLEEAAEIMNYLHKRVEYFENKETPLALMIEKKHELN